MPYIYDLRWRVFVKEQKVPFLLEMDASDTAPDTIHLAAIDGGKVVGTARIMNTDDLTGTAGTLGPEPGILRIGRVAVDKAWRGKGVGRQLMEGAHRIIQARLDAAQSEHGAGAEGEGSPAQTVRVRLDAQVQAKDFYTSLGYRVLDGEEYMDAGIMHVEMELVLEASATD